MATWRNIFETGEWQVFVKYFGTTVGPTPDSRAYLVRAEDLDPAVGTVVVDEDGLIQCDFEAVALAGGIAPQIIVMPQTSIPPLNVRVTATAPDGFASGVASSAFTEVLTVQSSGTDVYSATLDDTNLVVFSNPTEWTTPTALPQPLQNGSGLAFTRVQQAA
jgi:hypothetical protein